jgi:hypothetical protein
MPSPSQIVEYLHTHKFKEHPNGNYALYGLALLGCHSIIQYDNDIWMFYAYESGTNNAIYYNKDRKPITLNMWSPEIEKMNIVRMIEDD